MGDLQQALEQNRSADQKHRLGLADLRNAASAERPQFLATQRLIEDYTQSSERGCILGHEPILNTPDLTSNNSAFSSAHYSLLALLFFYLAIYLFGLLVFLFSYLPVNLFYY